MNIANIYPWTRYWVPRDKGYTPEGAYLADPESEYAWADANRAVSLATLRNKPVLVLLGEAGTRYRHGIYLVGWYGPPEKRKSCNKTLDKLRSQLDEQARQLSKNSLHIHAVTLDLSYPSKPHPDTTAPI